MIVTYTEKKFMDYIWDHEPVKSKDVVDFCRDRFDWKSTTTYTFMKRLSDKKVIVNDSSIITSLISRGEIEEETSKEVINEGFRGSLPDFLVAFLKGRTLSEKECDELTELISSHKEMKHE